MSLRFVAGAIGTMKQKLIHAHEIYIIRIFRWSYSYAFSREGRGRATSTLSFYGDVISPKQFRYEHSEIALFDDTAPDNSGDRAIGFLRCREDELLVTAWLPDARFGELAAVAASSRLQLVTVFGTKLRYRKADAYGIDISTGFSENER
jgi:hypothetical protein